MTTTARQPEPRSVDPDERASTVEVLIPEARARARRRRTIYTVLALVLLGGFALAVNGVDGDERTGEPAARLADRIAVGVTGSSCLPLGQLPQVSDPLIGGDRGGALIAESSAVDAASAGAPCKLVLRYGFHRLGDGAVLFKSGMVWLFSDGRIIVDTDRDGFVLWERRLTTEGVERVRSHAAAALGAPITTPEVPQLWLGRASIQYGDHRYHPSNPDQFVRLFDDLSWLPASAWVNTKPMAYVPPWYATCYEPLSARLEPSAVLELMPPRARQLLDGKAATVRYWWERTTPCAILENREAQLIFDEFAQAGLPREGQTGQADTSLPACNWAGGPAPRSYPCSVTFGSNEARAQITFFALMPNGQMALHGD